MTVRKNGGHIHEDPRELLHWGARDTRNTRKVLHVTYDEMSSRLRYVLYSGSGVRDYGDVMSPGVTEIEDILASFSELLLSAAMMQDGDPEIDSARLNVEGMGMGLCNRLLPPTLRGELGGWGQDEELSVSTNEDWIPWEVLHDGRGFWSERFGLVRLPRVRTRRLATRRSDVQRQAAVSGVAVIGGGLRRDLEAELEEYFRGRIELEVVREIGVEEFVRKVAGAHFVYVIGHGFSRGGVRISEDDRPVVNLLPSTMNHAAWDLPDRSLVFLNACSAARPRRSLGEFIGFGRSFFEVGATTFIGPIAEVSMRLAPAFAREFYRRIFEDTDGDVVDAVRGARCDCASISWPGNLTYALFINPLRRKMAVSWGEKWNRGFVASPMAVNSSDLSHTQVSHTHEMSSPH